VRRIPTPGMLQPTSDNDLSFDNFKHMGKAGLYTPEAMEQLQRSFQLDQDRAALTSIFTLRMMGHDAALQNYDVVNLFSHDQMTRMARSLLTRIWDFFTGFGVFTSGVIGAWMTFRLAKYLLAVILNAVTLCETLGPHYLLVASL